MRSNQDILDQKNKFIMVFSHFESELVEAVIDEDVEKVKDIRKSLIEIGGVLEFIDWLNPEEDRGLALKEEMTRKY